MKKLVYYTKLLRRNTVMPQGKKAKAWRDIKSECNMSGRSVTKSDNLKTISKKKIAENTLVLSEADNVVHELLHEQMTGLEPMLDSDDTQLCTFLSFQRHFS